MISIYCDEDVNILLKPLLEAKGFKVFTTLDEKILGPTDVSQMDHAIKNGHVFVTHNRIHYERLYSEVIVKGINHPGIIIANKRNVYELSRRLSLVLSEYSKESIKNLLLYV